MRAVPEPSCIKHFHWLIAIELFWPITYDVTIVCIGNNCNIKPDLPESPFGKVVLKVEPDWPEWICISSESLLQKLGADRNPF